MSRSRIIAVALAIVAFGAAAAVVLPGLRPPTFHGTDLGPTSTPREFTLQAAGRGPVSLSDYRGKVAVLFFGYTSCPDVCPTTMARLRQVMERLGDRRTDVQVLLITVDPEVDTPAKLREYVQAFDLGFVGLGGDRETLAEVARSFGAYAGEPQPPAPSNEGHGDHGGETASRMIPHTSHVFGIDRAGRLRVLWGPELGADEIAADVRGLLRL